MTSRATHSQHITTTIDRLFRAAFTLPQVVYQRESLCGWRPLRTIPHTPAYESDICGDASESGPPGITINETAGHLFIEVELPRIKADSLYIEISGDLLIIRGERDMAPPQGRKTAKQTSGPMVHRYIQLPVVARPGQVQARLEGNTVKVNIQKRPGAL